MQVIKSTRMRWTGHVARTRIGEVHTGLCRKPEAKQPLEIHRHRWEDNIEMDLQEVGWGGGMDWVDMAGDMDKRRALVNAVINNNNNNKNRFNCKWAVARWQWL